MKFSKGGALVLGIWLVLQGIMSLLHIYFSGSGLLLSILAIVAGVMILFDR